MGFDIRTFTNQGVTRYEPTWYDFTGNTRNNNQYRILFRYFVFNPESKIMTAFFKVERFELQNGEYVLGLSYTFEASAAGVMVDYEGNVIEMVSVDDLDEEDNVIGSHMEYPAEAVMTEYDRMAIFFNAPLPDSVLVDTYVADCFERGLFDFPKNRTIS